MKKIIFPQKDGNFYLLSKLFGHIHDAESASCVYVIPWENSLVIVTKRDEKSAGCVGCVIRRFISTTYQKKEKICGVDSVWLDNLDVEKIIPIVDDIIDDSVNSTKCYFYKFDTKIFEEIHILPAPSCSCSKFPAPLLSPSFVETWIQKWPNILIHKKIINPSNSLLHLHSTKLPNSAPLFISNYTNETCVPSSATVASLRDEASLSDRLLGESIERYSMHYVPFDRLFTAPENSAILEKKVYKLNPIIWTKVMNSREEEVFYRADEVYSGLNKLYSNQFRPLSSSGVAAYRNIEFAKTNALLELLERDALLTGWRLADNELKPFRCLPSSLTQNRETKWVEKLVSQQGQELLLCGVVNQFNLPIVLAISLPLSDTCKFVPNFGSGISFSWENAYKKALKELLQGIAIPDTEICESVPTSFIERPRYWAHPKQLPILRKRLTPLEEMDNMINFNESFFLKNLLQKFDDINLSLFFADLTPPDIRLSNWKVIRAICPLFEPFVSNSLNEIPNIDRINHFLSLRKEKPVDCLNINPFPFP